jgi:hypothetical protein
MRHLTQIDLFQQSVLLESPDGRQILYTIELNSEHILCCFIQKRKSSKSKWSEKRLVDSAKNELKFEYADTDAGFLIKRLDKPQDI